MISQLFKKKKELTIERTYEAPVEAVWREWTQAERLRERWGPENTTIPECEIDLRVGGQISIVMEAGEGMGKYQGTRWPLEATISHIEENARLTYDARSWTEGKEETTTIHHVNDLALTEEHGVTLLTLQISITSIGSEAKMAAFGMKWGHKQQLETLAEFLSKRA